MKKVQKNSPPLTNSNQMLFSISEGDGENDKVDPAHPQKKL